MICISCSMVHIFFSSEFSDILDKAGRKTKRRRRTQAIAKRYAFRAKAIIYCCVSFDEIGNTIDETMQRQHLNQYINIY